MTRKAYKLILSELILAFSLFTLIACGHQNNRESNKISHRIAYLVMISNHDEEMQAGVLINSIRKFGGSFSNEPVIVIRSNTADSLGEHIVKKADLILDLKMDESLRKIPFSDKVFACAQVEAMVEDSVEWLLWLNPDALLFNPPEKILAGPDKWVSIRPVHITNVGSDFNGSIDAFWRNIYLETGVDTTGLWPVESFVDNRQLRPYYNSGCMAFRPDKKLLRTWKDLFCKMLSEKRLYSFYLSEESRAIFFHQAVLSAVIISSAGKDRINILPPAYSYPLVLQKNEPFRNKIDTLPGIDIVLSGGYQNLNLLRMAEPYKTWVNENIK